MIVATQNQPATLKIFDFRKKYAMLLQLFESNNMFIKTATPHNR